jgi:hypothetical protein
VASTITLRFLAQNLDDRVALDVCAAPLSALDELHFFLAAADVDDVVGCAHGGLVIVSEQVSGREDGGLTWW